MKREEATWLAAAIDGEGSIGLYSYARDGRRVLIQMGMTNRAFVERVKELCGGHGSICVRDYSTLGAQHKGRKTMFHWALKGSQRCYPILKAILPFLIIKKEKAEKIITELESKPFGRWGQYSVK